jgi:hypothetical protein
VSSTDRGNGADWLLRKTAIHPIRTVYRVSHVKYNQSAQGSRDLTNESWINVNST